MDIRPFVPAELSDRELSALFRLSERIRAERKPDDSPLNYENFTAGLLNIPPVVAFSFWAVWKDANDEVIARGSVGIPLVEGNEHIGQMDLMVLPEWRRHGIASELLRAICGQMHAMNRQLLFTETSSTIPAGEAFLRRIGGQSAVEGSEQLLDLATVDRALMRQWIQRAQERATGFALTFWEGGYPEDRIEDVAAMLDAFNTQPLGDLDVEDFHFTPEHVRGLDSATRARGITRWTVVAEEQAAGTIAGFSELSFTDNQPATLTQGLTAVFPDYRNRGVGRWLKAAMIEKVLDELVDARVILTDNATDNAAMLRINAEMGYRPGRATAVWQVTVDAAEAYLSDRE